MNRSQHLENLHKLTEPVLNALSERVSESIKTNKLLSTDLIDEVQEDQSFGDRIADKVAVFGGSWSFILSFTGTLIVWIILNVVFLSNKGFDPYPFIFLNLVLSCIAAMQAPFIMMSQNRKEIIDRKRAQNDYMINLKAEIEIRDLHDKVDKLIKLFEEKDV